MPPIMANIAMKTEIWSLENLVLPASLIVLSVGFLNFQVLFFTTAGKFLNTYP